jgi:hypothetical protein
MFLGQELKQVLNHRNLVFNMCWKFCGKLGDDDLIAFAMPQGRMKKEYLKVGQVGGGQLGDLETDSLCMLRTRVFVTGRKTTEIED